MGEAIGKAQGLASAQHEHRRNWSKAMSDNAALALVVYTGLQIFVTVEALNALPGVSCADPGGAFYAFADIRGTGLTSMDTQTLFLEEAGVATVAGTSFGANGEGFLRISYANSEANISKAMERIGAVLAAR